MCEGKWPRMALIGEGPKELCIPFHYYGQRNVEGVSTRGDEV